MRKLTVLLVAVFVLALASVAGAEVRTAGPGPLERPAKALEHGSIVPFEHGSIVIW